MRVAMLVMSSWTISERLDTDKAEKHEQMYDTGRNAVVEMLSLRRDDRSFFNYKAEAPAGLSRDGEQIVQCIDPLCPAYRALDLALQRLRVEPRHYLRLSLVATSP